MRKRVDPNNFFYLFLPFNLLVKTIIKSDGHCEHTTTK